MPWRMLAISDRSKKIIVYDSNKRISFLNAAELDSITEMILATDESDCWHRLYSNS